ncbi:MAG TPA: helix-turn-helix domain-containing protein [Bryobacteraceae bacterium]
MRPSAGAARQSRPPTMGVMFEQQFVDQLIVAFTPRIKELIKQVISAETAPPLVVDYEEAGRMIGTSYEGIRKLVRKGKLTAVSRSGRYRGIAVQELKDYVERSQLISGWGG